MSSAMIRVLGWSNPLRARATNTVRQLCSSPFPKTEFIEITEPFSKVFNVRLNRPDRRNAFTLPLWRELRTVFDYLNEHSGCRAIVLSGAGKSFCAGIDLKEGAMEIVRVAQDESLDVGRKARLLRRFLKECQDSYTSPEKCQKPVIAAIQGHCVGAGISLIASADVRYASNDAVFSIREVDVGIAADVGILNRINKLVGNDSLTRELAFTARDIGASEALKYGLISRQFPTAEECLDASLALAVEIASKSPIAVQGTKLALNYARDHTIDDSLNFICTWNQSQLQSEDLLLAATAVLTKKETEFKDV